MEHLSGNSYKDIFLTFVRQNFLKGLDSICDHSCLCFPFLSTEYKPPYSNTLSNKNFRRLQKNCRHFCPTKFCPITRDEGITIASSYQNSRIFYNTNLYFSIYLPLIKRSVFFLLNLLNFTNIYRECGRTTAHRGGNK